MTKTYYTVLPNRAAVRVSGPDALIFLQGLVTQDIVILDRKPLAYSALLTPQGKFEYDFFMKKQDDAIILECEAARAETLAKKLQIFKLRRNVTIAVKPIQVTTIWGDSLSGFSYPADPRSPDLCLRAYDLSSPPKAEDAGFELYDRFRIALTIPDGSRDLAVGEDTVADIGLERLNGVSFTKGCYMGQELTSRMHHRRLSKKGLYTVTMTGEPLPPFTDIIVDNNLIGEMRSSNGNQGLAMLRHENLSIITKAGLNIVNHGEAA